MTSPLIAIIGSADPDREYNPPLRDPSCAKAAAEDLGRELAQRGAHLLVYGGNYIEADAVRGFVNAKPKQDRSIVKCYSETMTPAPFPEEAAHANLFDPRPDQSDSWEAAFYRSLAKADGVFLLGGGYSTLVAGLAAIGSRMPMLAISTFGGAAQRVRGVLSAGEDLPNRDDIDLMGQPWTSGSATACVNALLSQQVRRRTGVTTARPILAIIAGLLFVLALATVPWVLGANRKEIWMLFFAPPLAGGAGAGIRAVVDHLRGTLERVATAAVTTIVLGLVAGGIAGLLFVTAQLSTAEIKAFGPETVQRLLAFAVGVGFVAGLTSDTVFGKLLGIDVIRTDGVTARSPARR